ncbi:MAG: cyclic-di-AMP receptor [Clostridiales bacterium]|nr:cyclic-di-AMP receptor [Clostridiales bacterium]
MKLVFAIVHDEDEIEVMKALNASGFSVTKLCSTGGFLRAGNTTLLVGVPKEKVDEVIDIIKAKSKSRKKLINSANVPAMGVAMTAGYPVEITLGGATIFVVAVERHEKA